MSAARILVVEDDPNSLRAMELVLNEGGYLTESACNAEDALEHLAREAFDLVLMDIRLPGLDGKEATRRIRQDHPRRGLPIIALTIYDSAGLHSLILESGANEIIVKPLEEELLLNRTQFWLEQANSSA